LKKAGVTPPLFNNDLEQDNAGLVFERTQVLSEDVDDDDDDDDEKKKKAVMNHLLFRRILLWLMSDLLQVWRIQCIKIVLNQAIWLIKALMTHPPAWMNLMIH